MGEGGGTGRIGVNYSNEMDRVATENSLLNITYLYRLEDDSILQYKKPRFALFLSKERISFLENGTRAYLKANRRIENISNN